MNRRKFLTQTGIGAAAVGLGAPWSVAGSPAASARMPVYVFSKHLQFLGYEALAEKSAELGFDGIDLTVRRGGHVLPERVRADLPRAVKAIRTAGQRIDSISTDIHDPASPQAREVLECAREEGIQQYRMGPVRYDLDQPDGFARQIAEFNESSRGLAALNQEVGLPGCIQNHSNHYLGGLLVDTWSAIKDLDPNWIGCHFDISHAVAESAVSWRVGFNLLAPRIKALVVKDFQFNKTDRGIFPRWVPLGTGMVPWDLYWPLVRKAGLRVPIILHLEYGEKDGHEAVMGSLKQDLETLRGMLKQHFPA